MWGYVTDPCSRRHRSQTKQTNNSNNNINNNVQGAREPRIIIYYDAGDVELSPIRRNDAKTCFPSTQAGPSRKVGDDTTKTIAVRCIYMYTYCWFPRIFVLYINTFITVFTNYILYTCIICIDSLYSSTSRTYIIMLVTAGDKL